MSIVIPIVIQPDPMSNVYKIYIKHIQYKHAERGCINSSSIVMHSGESVETIILLATCELYTTEDVSAL